MKNKTYIKTSLGDIYELEPYMVVRKKRVFNTNTKRFEALNGDYVIIDNKTHGIERVKSLTNGQIVPTERRTYIVSGDNLNEINYYDTVTVEEKWNYEDEILKKNIYDKILNILTF